MVALKFIFIIFCCYLIGNVSFAKIISSSIHHNDITKEGSGNPGVMNVLRTHGLRDGLLVLLCDAVKAGLPALLSYFILKPDGVADVGYFVAGLCVVLGHNFPMVFNFKGGKGVACTFGTFLFNPHCWWVSMIVFVAGFLLFLLIEYPFIISFFAITSLCVYATIFFTINKYADLATLLVFIWIFFVLTIVMHRKNIVRLVQGKENKINFRLKVKKFFTGKKGIEIIEEDEVKIRDPKAEEIVIYDLPRAKVKTKEEIKEEEKKKREIRLKNKRKQKEKNIIVNEPIVSSSEKLQKENLEQKNLTEENSIQENVEENNIVYENVQNEIQTEDISEDKVEKENEVQVQEETKGTEKSEVENESVSEIKESIEEIDSDEKQESTEVKEDEMPVEENVSEENKEEKPAETLKQEDTKSEEISNKTKGEKSSKSSKPKKERKLKFYQQTSIFENRDGEEV